MTALWTVIVLLSILAAVDSVAVIALTRQLGLLHLRMEQQPVSRAHRGPQPGTRLRLDVPPDVTGDNRGPDLILFGFVRPACGGCAAALPAFTAVAAGLPAGERAILVSDAAETAARAYLAAHDVTLPLVTGPHVLRANDIPGVPYVVIADRAGIVMAADAAISAEQLEAVLGQARRSRQAAAR